MTEASFLDERRKILVVGDAMIDRSWIVAEGAETSQAHAEVAPKKVVDPGLRNVRPGGAGLTATWLAWHQHLHVRLLAQAGTELKVLLEDAKVTLFPELVGGERQSTTKFRIYAWEGKDRVPTLRHRYDLDIPAEDFTLPDIPKADLVVIADFQKGMVTTTRLKELAIRLPDIPWLVDSKDPAILDPGFHERLRARPTLFVNRTEFARIAARFGEEFRSGQALSGPWHHIKEHVLQAARAFHDKYDKWDLVVKLDRDGALAFWADGSRWTFAYVPALVVKDAVGVGAGDAFIAGWASAALEKKLTVERLASAVGHASAWLQVTEEMPYATSPSDVPAPADWNQERPWPAPAVPKPLAVSAGLNEVIQERSFENIIGRGVIDLSLASGYCGQFMTLNPKLGATVRYFTGEIQSFFRSKDARRPLNCLVWAAPGSGKSFLVEEVARHVGIAFHEINVSTLVDREELNRKLKEASGLDAGAVLVMIDECAAEIGGEYIFSGLLAPLWTKPKAKKIAFVLVDSHDGSQSAEDFANFVRGQKKGKDLISRINGPYITLTAPSEVDRAVLVASLIRRLHSRSAFEVESTALRALAREGSKERWSPRSIEYIIEAVVPSGHAVRFDDLRRLRDLCERLHVSLDEPVGASTMVKILDAKKENEAS